MSRTFPQAITHTIHGASLGGALLMGQVDYDRALYYAYRSQWDNMLILMVRTKDDLLSKKIEDVLYAYHFSTELQVVEHTFSTLIHYLDHANECLCNESLEKA